MAENDVIETLKIKVEMSTGNTKPSNTINNISKSLEKLQKANDNLKLTKLKRGIESLNNIDLSRINRQLGTMLNRLKQLQGFKNFTMNIRAGKSVSDFLNGYGNPRINASSSSSNVTGASGEVPFNAPSTYVVGQQWENETKPLLEYNDSLRQQVEITVLSTKRIYTLKDRLKDLADNFRNVRTEMKKSAEALPTLLRAIKRIALYRLIRRVLQIVTQQISQGLNRLAKISPQTNKDLSEIKSILTQVGNQLAITTAILLNTFMPVLQSLGNSLTNTLNSMNELFSVINGNKTMYKAVKVNEDYVKSLDDMQNKMLGFDEINTFGQNIDASKYFEEVDLSNKTLLNAIGDWFKSLEVVQTTVDAVKSWSDTNMSIANNLYDMWEWVTADMMSFEEMWQSMKNTFNDLKNFFSDLFNFDNFKSKVVEPAVNVASKVGNAIGNTASNVWSGIKSGASAAWVGAKSLVNGIFTRANGGFVNNASLFYANENGMPELVGQVGNRAAVANNDQIISGIKQGVYEAMQDSQGDIIIQLIDQAGNVKSEEIVSSLQRKNRRDGKTVVPVMTY